MRPLVRWTIGPVSHDGFRCLRMSINKMRKHYDIEPVVCYNGIDPSVLVDLDVTLINQSDILSESDDPIGVTWKLYPPRLDISRHELFIDNDLIIEDKIEAIDRFFETDSVLLLEGSGRNYGQFERHVPTGYNINSGLFGVSPGFDLAARMKFYGTKWERNLHTFDEQGLVATSLLNYQKFAIIPKTVITNCEQEFVLGNGFHFIGLNRTKVHRAFRQYCLSSVKFFL